MEQTAFQLGEMGKDRSGQPRTVHTRLYLQFHAFGGSTDDRALCDAVQTAAKSTQPFEGVLYKDLNDPQGIAVLAVHEDPEYFVTDLRGLLTAGSFASLSPKPEMTMFGRTYSIGYEVDLEDVLLSRPRRRIYDPAYRWAVWYPLRRAGSFERLDPKEQNAILMEHAGLGISFSQTGFGQDIRLACHGLDKNDNDFVIGLVGPDLYPLSAMVQAMRKTTQTSLHLESLGPFFTGRTLWQSKPPPEGDAVST